MFGPLTIDDTCPPMRKPVQWQAGTMEVEEEAESWKEEEEGRSWKFNESLFTGATAN